MRDRWRGLIGECRRKHGVRTLLDDVKNRIPFVDFA